jgi:hypothetical protein
MEQEWSPVEVLTTRDCADWMGCSLEWVRHCINVGVTTPTGGTVKLAAAAVRTGRRRLYRVYRDQFMAFLIALRWPRIPRPRATVRAAMPPGGANGSRRWWVDTRSLRRAQ